MRPKIGLVLGGGGSRGLAHIGVLHVLEREHIPIDVIVGTSMGAMIGAAYALGHSPETIAQFVQRLDSTKLFALNIFSAHARQRAVRNILQTAIGDSTFADLKIPMAAMAVDLVTGAEIMLTEGEVIPAVLASSALPGVFPTVEIDRRQLADGGVIDCVATKPALDLGADCLIVVDVYPELAAANIWEDPLSATFGVHLPGFLSLSQPGILTTLWRSHRVMAWHIHTERLKACPPDILLRPSVEQYGMLDFKDVQGPIAAGIAEAEKHLPAIRALLTEQHAYFRQLPPQ
jgi:NTE family protein